MKLVLIGADGQLGWDLMKVLPPPGLTPLTYPDFDVTKPEVVRRTLLRLKPEAVINTSAFNRVDDCESDPWPSFRVNALAVRDLALVCRDLGAVLVHFSTDYVFDGARDRPYTEDDQANPLSTYALSKLTGEYFLKILWPKHFLIRTCGLYGEAGSREKGTNFVESMIALEKKGASLRVVSDQRVTPTATAELAPRVWTLVQTGQYGLYHMTNEGACSWFEFAAAIFELLGRPSRPVPVSSDAFGAPAKRPPFSVLENRRYNALGLPPFSHWKEALRVYLGQKGHLAAGT
jgi:dTDP-4-dehydrorhamnose reductase